MYRQQQVSIRPQSVGAMTNEIIVKPLASVMKRYPVITVSWALGLMVLIFATGTELSPREAKEYSAALEAIDFEGLEKLRIEMEVSRQIYERSRGWFWACESECQKNRKEYEEKRQSFETERNIVKNMLSNAKAQLSLFSEVSIEQARALLYQNVDSGKEFAKRMTWYDVLFSGFTYMGRDESFVGYFIRIIFNFILNLFIGLIGACTVFLWNVVDLVKSFQPSWPEAILFFAGCISVVIAILVSFCLGIYLTCTSVVIGASSLLITQASGNRHQIR